ncbi:7608_t:CDS:2, partial [Funneliformis geosporum]
SSSSKKHEVKRYKYRNNPDPKWMNNAKKYTNELAKGTINYRKQSIDQHLTHHEHKAEAEARKSY